jgi:hypothetical protein
MTKKMMAEEQDDEKHDAKNSCLANKMMPQEQDDEKMQR